MARHELTRAQVLEHALEIAEEYRADNLTLTLRQMYYQFVSRGDVLTEARYDGSHPVDWLDTTEAWELDALEPRVLCSLIRENA
jgi:hypothetical protein